MVDRAFDRLPTSGRAEIDLEAQLPQLSPQPVTAKLDGPFVASGGGAIPSFDLDLEAEASGFGVDGKLVSTGGDAFVVFFGENYRVGAPRVAELGQRAAGIDPRGWFGPPRYAGTEEAGGTDSYRIEAPLSSEQVSADLAEMGLAAVGSSGLEGGTIEASVGADDGVIHGLRVSSEALDLHAVLSDLGEAETIEPPPGGGFKPVEQLLDRVRDLSGGL
jgi:hypothetical protein